jgi:hypothetical protein
MILGLRPGPMGEGAVAADAAGLDFVLLGGHGDPMQTPMGEDALSVAAFLMTQTRAIGLAAAVSTDWAPFNVARALASFDRLSGGRCGWAPWPGAGGEDRFAEHLDVVMQLFDSWDDDALVLDKASGVFADRDKVRRIRHAGTYYTVDGPLNAPRPLQGRPVMFQPLDQAGPFADVGLAPLDGLRPGPRPPLLLAEVVVNDDPAALAPRLTEAFARGDCDGFLFETSNVAGLLGDLTPWLGARPAVTGDLRTRLGLPRPVNRFSGQP